MNIKVFRQFFFQHPRILKYKLLSTCKKISGKPKIYQPTQFLGKGTVTFGKNVKLGYNPSPNFYNGYGYIDARNKQSIIDIGDDVWINNCFVLISEGEGIVIGQKTIIGLNVEITDSDFHDLHPAKRIGGIPKTSKVRIGKNVFIGSNVKILKGVSIGDNTVIANSSVVTKSIPANVIAGGYPCSVKKNLDIN